MPTKPYDGTILIRFLKRDKDEMGDYVNNLTTRIILKPGSEYYITYSRGQYVSDHFLARILKYLEIDESKVPALDAYRKSIKNRKLNRSAIHCWLSVLLVKAKVLILKRLIMNKVYMFWLLCFLISCNNTRDGINKKLLDSVYEIHIKNNSPESYGGFEEYKIKDKKEISSFCKELLSLNQENNLESRPFDGAILIEFYKNNTDGSYDASNLLSTGVVFKPNDEYFINYSKGRFKSDHFLARILKYLEIDESKIPALDAYRKSKNLKENR